MDGPMCCRLVCLDLTLCLWWTLKVELISHGDKETSRVDKDEVGGSVGKLVACMGTLCKRVA
jgi:hypothetical protein